MSEFDLIFDYVFDKKFNFIQCDRRNDFNICKNFSPLQITVDKESLTLT